MAAVPRLAAALKEVRLHLSQTSSGSQGARAFISNNYAAIKKANPSLPFLIREAESVEARVFGRYEFGQERKISLENLSESQIMEKLRELAETKPSTAQKI